VIFSVLSVTCHLIGHSSPHREDSTHDIGVSGFLPLVWIFLLFLARKGPFVAKVRRQKWEHMNYGRNSSLSIHFLWLQSIFHPIKLNTVLFPILDVLFLLHGSSSVVSVVVLTLGGELALDDVSVSLSVPLVLISLFL
jgi:hypothetical protein